MDIKDTIACVSQNLIGADVIIFTCPCLTADHVRGITASCLSIKYSAKSEWAVLTNSGVTKGAPIDLADGFVHFSTAAQVAETAAKHFAQEDDLMLLALEADLLGPDLKWEPSRGGALFPHLYRALYLDDIVWSKPLPKVNGTHQFPEDMS